MIARLFHAWERRLVAVTTDRVVRPFDWGLDWLPDAARTESPAEALRAWAAAATAGSDRFYATPPAEGFRFDGHRLDYPSAVETPHPENNVVRARYFAAARPRAAAPEAARRAVVVLPQWNADAGAHVGLSRLIARFGISALRLSLPYHDARMPPELHRADYIVSANIGRTLQVCRQAVLDARRAVDWLRTRGYQRIGILGTSLGSCLALLTAAHDRRITAAALNHISPYFADVVWEGLSTAHVREGLDGSVDLSCCAICGCRSARPRTSSGCGGSASSSSTRATTTRSRCGCPGSSWRTSGAAGSTRRCSSCRAATTARGSHRSVGSMGTP